MIQKHAFDKKCEYCNTTFTTNNAKKKYCSSTCKTYNSLEKKGKLNNSSKMRIEGIKKKNEESQQKLIPNQNKTKNDQKENIVDQLIESYLNSLFSIEDGYYFYIDEGQAGEKMYIEGKPIYLDIILNVKRVRKTPSGNYIVTSTSGNVIEEIRKKFNGSDIFKGQTSKIERELMDPYNKWLINSIKHSMPEAADELKAITPKNREEYYLTFSTLLQRDKIIEVGKIPYEQI